MSSRNKAQRPSNEDTDRTLAMLAGATFDPANIASQLERTRNQMNEHLNGNGLPKRQRNAMAASSAMHASFDEEELSSAFSSAQNDQT